MNKPYSIQLELHYGCNLRCDCCYKQVHNIKKSQFKSMKKSTAIKIAKDLVGYDPIRITYAQRGEPTLNKDWIKITKILRSYLPQSQILCTTNGLYLNKDNIGKFFSVGGNILLVDCYKKDFSVRMEKWKKFKPIDYYDENNKFNPFCRNSPKSKKLILLDNIMENNKKKSTRVIWNMGGNVDFDKVKKYGVEPLSAPLKKKCTYPFREMTIHYDGEVAFCCMDGNQYLKLGNVLKTPIDKIWNSKKYNVARLLLYNKKRCFAPCKNCDYFGGMRQGLIPKMKIVNDEELKKYCEMIK